MITTPDSKTFSPNNSFSPDTAVPQSLSALTINQTPIPLEQILTTLRATGQLQPLLETLAGRYVLEQTFQRRSDLTVAAADLEQAVQQFKRSFPASELQTWLLDRAWDEAILHQQLAFDLKLSRLKAEIAAPKLLETFMAQKLTLDRVVLSRIVVERCDLAEELRLMLAEQEASFEQLARDYSVAADAVCNGMMGSLSRAEVQDILGLDPYQATPQSLLGPICHQNQWWLIRVEAMQPASLDEAVTHQLQEQIFSAWLTRQIATLEITLRIGG